jgi:uncharacterized protein with PQ loop repeat
VSIQDVLAIVATTLGVGMGASPLLQASRVQRRRRSDDVSLPFLLVLWIGGLAWLAYGVAIGNLALVIANAVGVSASSTTIAIVVVWRRQAGAAEISSRA